LTPRLRRPISPRDEPRPRHRRTRLRCRERSAGDGSSRPRSARGAVRAGRPGGGARAAAATHSFGPGRPAPRRRPRCLT
jgi:hypothetical protein